jgi:tungstate transport system substrate-binding protein
MAGKTGIILKNVIPIFILVVFIRFTGLYAEENSSRELRVIFPVTSVSPGLANALVKLYENEYNIPTKIYSLCTGDAITFIKDHVGIEEIDVMLGHDREAEEKFVRDGYAVNLRSVFFSDYVLVGPAEDPAKIKGMTSPFNALKKIAKKKLYFCSRADLSGTHGLEMQIWRKTGIKPRGDWYLQTKVGTSETLLIANRKRAYFISHTATFMQMKESIDLVPLIEDRENLISTYEVLTMNPEKFPEIKYVQAMHFIGFLTSARIQKYIAEFGIAEFGRPIFFPMAVKIKEVKE